MVIHLQVIHQFSCFCASRNDCRTRLISGDPDFGLQVGGEFPVAATALMVWVTWVILRALLAKYFQPGGLRKSRLPTGLARPAVQLS